MTQHRSPPTNQHNPIRMALGHALSAVRARLPLQRLAVCVACVVAMAASGPSAQGAFQLIFDQSAYSGFTGQKIPVQVILQATGADTATQITQFGVRVTYSKSG